MGFYSIQSRTTDGNKGTFQVKLDAEHKVYEGHFPGQPVTPGVLQVRIIRDLIEEMVGRKMELDTARSIKFIRFVDPRATDMLTVSIDILSYDDGIVQLRSDIADEDGPYFKMMAGFSERS